MRFPYTQVLSGLAATAAAANLYVSSYAGTVTSLSLKGGAGSYTLAQTAVNQGSAPSPSWLELGANGIVYCVDEGFTSPNGSLTSYKTSSSGELTVIDRVLTLGGPVASIQYNGGKAIALAHYGASALSTWSSSPNGSLSLIENFVFTLSAPGAEPARQNVPHVHETLLDPTGAFIVAPDLGADLLRVFSINDDSSLTESTPFSTPAGSGPRHGKFLKTAGGSTYFYLVSELANTVAAYQVTYGDKALSFEEIQTSGIYGDMATPAGAAAAEAVISPDSKFLLTSSRNDSLFEIANFDTTNSTKIPSDTLQSWAIDQATGKLTFSQLAPAGGMYPRQFSVNQAGTLAAVGLQNDDRVVIVERDVATGNFGKFVAHIDIPGQVTSVIWDE